MAENLVLVDETVSSTLIFVGVQAQPVDAAANTTGAKVELAERLAAFAALLICNGVDEFAAQSHP